MDPTEKTYDAGQVRLNYAEGPDNGPPLLLIHGLGGMWQNFSDVYGLVRDRWHVYLVDLRGHGKSSHADETYSWKSYATDVIAFMGGVIPRPAVVWGHSLGAITAMGIAADAPGLVLAAVLEDPPMMIADSAAHEPFMDRFKITEQMIRDQPPDDEVMDQFRTWQPGASEDAIRRRLLAVRCADFRVYSDVISGRGRKGWDPEGRLAAISAPVLLMQADPDAGGVVQDEHAARAMELLKDGELRKFPGVGHGIHAAALQETVDLMEKFVRERTVAGR